LRKVIKMNWEDIVKQEDLMREKRISTVKGINAVRNVLESLYDSLDGFMRDSDEEDGPYQEAQDMKNDISKIWENTGELQSKMFRLLIQYKTLVKEHSM